MTLLLIHLQEQYPLQLRDVSIDSFKAVSMYIQLVHSEITVYRMVGKFQVFFAVLLIVGY